MTPKKMGRPLSPNPLSVDVKVRFDKELSEKLDSYCERENTTRAETIRAAVEYFLNNRK